MSLHGRPYLVIRADRFAEALAATIDDPDVRALSPIGSVSQWIDSTDVLGRPPILQRLKSAYGSSSCGVWFPDFSTFL